MSDSLEGRLLIISQVTKVNTNNILEEDLNGYFISSNEAVASMQSCLQLNGIIYS